MCTSSSAHQENPTDQYNIPHEKILQFAALCDEMKEVHMKKAHDYGIDDDPHANFNQAVDFGIDPFVGLMLRLNDKVTRVKNFVKKGRLANESVEDALRDISVYANIGRVMLANRSKERNLGSL